MVFRDNLPSLLMGLTPVYGIVLGIGPVDGHLRELTVRRLSQGENWGFTPVLHSKALFPKSLPTRLSLQPMGFRDVLAGAGMDVVMARKRFVFRSHNFGFFKKHQSVRVSDYIGVAVQYTARPERWRVAEAFNPKSYIQKLPRKKRISIGRWLERFNFIPDRLVDLFFDDVQVAGAKDEVVSLYLLHEERSKDLLLYYAAHDDDITALWQFWAKRLSLPQLLVGRDGFIDEPYAERKVHDCARAYPRARFKHMRGRRPIFLSVRDVGRGGLIARRCDGREIMARN